MSIVTSSYGNGIDICVSWVKASCGQIPARAVRAGPGCFVARAVHNGEFIPGKVLEGHGCCFVSYAGEEHSKSDYEILVETSVLGQCGVQWHHTHGSCFPHGAIVAGTDGGMPLYICRVDYRGETAVGKFFPQHGCSYIPYRCQEQRMESYDILCCIPKYM